jgi:hypothetical protein
MSYPSIKETFYRNRQDKHVVLTVPHGAGFEKFLDVFPIIKTNADLQKAWPTFMSYLAIEQDLGASEIAHAVAYELQLDNVAAHVVEVNYPRGIVDGGRLRDHCLRDCLPSTLAESLREELLSLHDQSLAFMDQLYAGLTGKVYLLDVHTMASFCPVDHLGRKRTFPVTFARLQGYVDQYLRASAYAHQRKIDLICSDESGHRLADPHLLSSIANALHHRGYAYLENEPYHAAPIYLSHQHMQRVPGLSIDIPKDLVARGEELDRLTIDAPKVKRLAQTLALGIVNAFKEE